MLKAWFVFSNEKMIFPIFDQNICCPFLKSQKEVNVLILCWPLLCDTKTTPPFEYFINLWNKKKTKITKGQRKKEKMLRLKFSFQVQNRTKRDLEFLIFSLTNSLSNPFKYRFKVQSVSRNRTESKFCPSLI